MIITRIISIYFSPNGTTKKIVTKTAKGIGNSEIQEIDLNTIESRKVERNFSKDELVIVGFPVYSGRLPKLSEEIFKNIKGNNTPAIAIVSYGNREYGDALLELKDNLIKSGMKVISGAAVVAEHCYNKNVATNRPDEKDDLKILDYANRVNDKIKNIITIEKLPVLYIKGHSPYRPLKSNQIPTGDKKCIECGICKESCPVNAIDEINFRLTDSDICIGCGRCINVCPTNARAIRNEGFIQFMKKLEDIAKERKEIEDFI
jgi:ferredoxin